MVKRSVLPALLLVSLLGAHPALGQEQPAAKVDDKAPTEPSSSDDAAAKAVRDLGGDVKVDANLPGSPVVSVTLWKDVTDQDLKKLRELKKLRALNLRSFKITDAGMKELKEIETLEELQLWDSPISDAGMKELGQFKNLRSLRTCGWKSDANATEARISALKSI